MFTNQQAMSKMAKKKVAGSKPSTTVANIEFEARLWLSTDKLGDNGDAAKPVKPK